MYDIELYKGNITELSVDAIVNAANKTLLGGGGVDGAIHRVAGTKLLEECRHLNGCETGKSKITSAYNLKCKYVIHTVGPIWKGGTNNEYDLLASAYKSALEITKNYNISSIAFPNISTGVYRFPKLLAARIAFRQVKEYLKRNNNLKKVVFSIFDEENYDIYTSLLLDNEISN